MILSFSGMVGGRCSCRVALSLAGRGFAGFGCGWQLCDKQIFIE